MALDGPRMYTAIWRRGSKSIRKLLIRWMAEKFCRCRGFQGWDQARSGGRAVFACESASGLDFARKLGIIAEGSDIKVDKRQQTNIEGIFAAGDCTGGLRQVSTSVGQGAVAGKALSEYIREMGN